MEESFAQQRVTVMGLGRFGAGIALTRFFAERDAQVTVTDLRTEQELAPSLDQLSDLTAVRYHLGGHTDEDFLTCDLLAISPAVGPDNPYLQLARQAGIPVTSEIRLFWERCPATVIGVTGSNGKSTTTSLIHQMLAAEGRRVWLGGNIGRPLLGDVEAIRPSDWVVLELSSFQLADLNNARRSPQVAVITNISPNHLDWHGSMSAYVDAKQSIVRWQTEGDIAVMRQGSPESEWTTRGRRVECGGSSGDRSSVRLDSSGRHLLLGEPDTAVDLDTCPNLRGVHQRTAAVLAAATARAVGVGSPAIGTALREFRGLPHRMQAIDPSASLLVINDSASTTPESTIVALEALAGRVTVIVGGREKGSPLEALADCMLRRATTAILLGDVQSKLAETLRRRRSELSTGGQPLRLGTTHTAANLAEAVDLARQGGGDVILFSPGFASGSDFVNFEHRGEAFVRLMSEA